MDNFESSTQERNPEEEQLLQQFNHAEEVDFNGEKVRVVDLQPEKLKSQIPTIMVHGLLSTPDSNKDLILRVAEAGRRVISADAPHGIEATERESELPEVQLRKLELLMQLIEKKGLDKVNIVAHSEGAIYVTAAAVLYPEKFANIVLINPAGLIGEDSLLTLIARSREDIKEFMRLDKEEPRQRVAYPPSPTEGNELVRVHPIAALKETYAIAHSDITSALEEVHKLGIGLSIIHGFDDKIFPMERVQKMVKLNMIDGFYSVAGTHANIQQYEPYGRAAEMVLTALEDKREKDSQPRTYTKEEVLMMRERHPAVRENPLFHVLIGSSMGEKEPDTAEDLTGSDSIATYIDNLIREG